MTPNSVRSRSLPLRVVLPAALAASVSLPDAARGQESVLGVGFFLGYAFESPGVERGVETFATRWYGDSQPCGDDPRSGYGPFLQFGAVKLGMPRVILGLQAGGELARGGTALLGELGGTYRFGEHAGLGLHLGASPQVGPFVSYLRTQLFLDQTSLGVGGRYPTFDVDRPCGSSVIPGRPLRQGPHRISIPAVYADERSCGNIREPSEERIRAGHAWARDAEYEAASVPAFLCLADDLWRAGAPAALVAAALRAARDEVRHAWLCAGLATHYLERNIVPLFPSVRLRPQLPRPAALVRLVTESYADGCIGELGAARVAELAAKRAGDPRAKRVQERIARDEHRHAELAYRIVEWALSLGDRAVRGALHAERDRPFAAAPTQEVPSFYGRASADEQHESMYWAHARAHARVAAMTG